jgi:RNA polymerase sigma factor (TIGR02999 family)
LASNVRPRPASARGAADGIADTRDAFSPQSGSSPSENVLVPPRMTRADPATPPPVEITRLLRQWEAGDLDARERVVEAVYAQVRAIAGGIVRANPGATLCATELAHEALARLLGGEATWENRRHFFHVVAQATRQILVDAARRRLAGKRGGGLAPLALDEAREQAAAEDEDLVRLHEALARLAARDERKARMLELTYFAGVEREDLARLMDVSVSTVDRDLRLGKAFLKRALEG